MNIVHTHKSFMILTLIVLASVSTAFATRSVTAANTSMTFTYLAGSGPLCALHPKLPPCPDIAVADNGDRISVNGSGTFSVFPNSVTGGGMFTHKNAAGTVLATGTWVATDLVSFVSYGNGVPQGFPATFFGGRAAIKVTLFVGSTPVHTAILAITCELGSAPDGHHEGITLNVQDAINFNKQVSGVTVFILHT